MNAPPELIDGFRVVCYSLIDERHRFTENVKHFIGDRLLGPMAGLAICKDQSGPGFYIFSCDKNWNCITDTYHESFEAAKQHAEFEYAGVSHTWIDALR